MKSNQTIVLYMNDGVECGRTKNVVEAYKLLQECKRSDKDYWNDYECKGKMPKNDYYFELEEETEDTVYCMSIKIYRRGNKVYMKGVE